MNIKIAGKPTNEEISEYKKTLLFKEKDEVYFSSSPNYEIEKTIISKISVSLICGETLYHHYHIKSRGDSYISEWMLSKTKEEMIENIKTWKYNASK